MLTKMTIKNFKKIAYAEIPLGAAVVFVGQNNSGKTSAMQAITLWYLGMNKWYERRKDSKAKTRTGVPINRQDIVTIPLPHAQQLWKNINLREQKNVNILITIEMEGITKGKTWKLGFEFEYANQEIIHCRKIGDEEFPKEVLDEKIGYLPPMSGLTANEDLLQQGSIQMRLGQGKTAEILRNLCWMIWEKEANEEKKEKWDEFCKKIKNCFGVQLLPPFFNVPNGQLSMTYKEGDNELDIAAGGRGFHQTVLLFAFIYANKNTILLLDEPDAHLEVIRQREIYDLLSATVKKENSQLIIATHAEEVLNTAADKDEIVNFANVTPPQKDEIGGFFIGEIQPRIMNQKKELVKSLREIGFDQYLLAEEKKWILFLEGSSDLDMLKTFADIVQHPVRPFLENAFVKYLGTNSPLEARKHFNALREAIPDFRGIALFDHLLNRKLQSENGLEEYMWERREIENYLPVPEVIQRYVAQEESDLFTYKGMEVMTHLIEEEGYIPKYALRDRNDNWWREVKMSDDVLDKLFKKYFAQTHRPTLLEKGSYFKLALLAHSEELDPEISKKLDRIWDVARASTKQKGAKK